MHVSNMIYVHAGIKIVIVANSSAIIRYNAVYMLSPAHDVSPSLKCSHIAKLLIFLLYCIIVYVCVCVVVGESNDCHLLMEI